MNNKKEKENTTIKSDSLPDSPLFNKTPWRDRVQYSHHKESTCFVNGHVKQNNSHSGSKLMEDGSAANKRVRRTSEMEVQLVDVWL